MRMRRNRSLFIVQLPWGSPYLAANKSRMRNRDTAPWSHPLDHPTSTTTLVVCLLTATLVISARSLPRSPAQATTVHLDGSRRRSKPAELRTEPQISCSGVRCSIIVAPTLCGLENPMPIPLTRSWTEQVDIDIAPAQLQRGEVQPWLASRKISLYTAWYLACMSG